jgi:hypothetical protein
MIRGSTTDEGVISMTTSPTPAGSSDSAPQPTTGQGAGPGFGPGKSGSSGPLPQGPAGPVAPPSTAAGTAPPGARVTVGTYGDYASAQQAVDHLSDSKFPVQHTAIVGTDLRLVENVIGRLTVGRAAFAGAGSGAWFGLFIGLLLGIFTNANWFGVVLFGVVIGALWGAAFGAIAQALTGGRRDFTSRSSLQASQYAVVVDAEFAEQARHLLLQLNWRASGAQ